MEEAYLHWYEEICQCLEGSYYHLVNCVHGIIEENKIQNGDGILLKILPFFVSHKKYPHSFSSLPSFATSSHSPSKPGSLRCLTTPAFVRIPAASRRRLRRLFLLRVAGLHRLERCERDHDQRGFPAKAGGAVACGGGGGGGGEREPATRGD